MIKISKLVLIILLAVNDLKSQAQKIKENKWILEFKENSSIVKLNTTCENWYNNKFNNRIYRIGKTNKYLNHENKLLELPKYDSICLHYFNENYYLNFRYKNKEIIWFEDTEITLPYQYEFIQLIKYGKDISKRYFIVSKNSMWGIINYKNEVIIPLVYENIEVGKYPILDNDSTFSPILIAKKNHRFGVIDLSSANILPFNYTYIEQLFPTIYKCTQDSLNYITNIKDGKEYIDYKSWNPDNKRIILDKSEDRIIYNLSGELDKITESEMKKVTKDFVFNSKRYIIYDSTGIEIKTDSIFEIEKIDSEYYIARQNTNQGRLKGIISAKNGAMLLKPEFIIIKRLNTDSLLFRGVKKDNSEYIINTKFQEIKIPGSYKYLEVMGPRLLRFSNNNPGFGIIDLLEAKVMLPFSTEETYGYLDGYYIYASRKGGAELLDSSFKKLGIKADNFFTFGDMLFANNWWKKDIGMDSRIYDKYTLRMLHDSIIKYKTTQRFVTIDKGDGQRVILDKWNKSYGKVPFEAIDYFDGKDINFLMLENNNKKGLYSIVDKKIILQPIYNNIYLLDNNTFVIIKENSLAILTY